MANASSIVLGLVLLFGTTYAARAEVGVGLGTAVASDNRVAPEDPEIRLDAGTKKFYVWGSLSQSGLKSFGQNYGDLSMIGAGLGYRQEFGPLRLFAEYGKFFVHDLDLDPGITNEIVHTTLNNNHGWRGARYFREHSYDLKNNYGFQLGASVEVLRHTELYVQHRFLKVGEEIDAWTGERHDWDEPDCGCWWQERNQLDLGQTVLGVRAKF